MAKSMFLNANQYNCLMTMMLTQMTMMITQMIPALGKKYIRSVMEMNRGDLPNFINELFSKVTGQGFFMYRIH